MDELCDIYARISGCGGALLCSMSLLRQPCHFDFQFVTWVACQQCRMLLGYKDSRRHGVALCKDQEDSQVTVSLHCGKTRGLQEVAVAV